MINKKVNKFIVCLNDAEIFEQVSNNILKLVKSKKEVNIYLGSIFPLKKFYDFFAKFIVTKKLSLSNVNFIITYDFVDISSEYKHLHCKNFIDSILFNKIKTKPKNIFVPPITETKKECANIFQKYPIDLLLISSTDQGSILMVNSKESWKLPPRISTIGDDLRESLISYFDEKINVPKLIVTFGTKIILTANNIFLLIYGKQNCLPLRMLLDTKPNKKWPITILRKHNNTTIFADFSACTLLN